MSESTLRPLTPANLLPALNPTLVTNGDGLFKLKKYFDRKANREAKPILAFDYETNIAGTFWDRKARTLQIGDKDEQYIIDLLHFAQSSEELVKQGGFQTPRWAEEIVRTIEPIMCGSQFLKVGQSLWFEYEQSSWNLGFRPWNLYSIDLAERIIWAGLHSFKDYPFYSMAAMAARHFGVSIDKSEQIGFDLETPLTDSQIIYTCFDLRIPLAIRGKQLPLLEQDGLERVTQVENDAIGYFVDIHLNGMRTDPHKWSLLVAEWTDKKTAAIQLLDTYFLPIVGPKNIDKTDLEPLLYEWESQRIDSAEEKEIKDLIRATKDKAEKEKLKAELVSVVTSRKAKAAEARKRYQEIKSRITAAQKIFDKCDGEASINYGSNAQLRKAFHRMKGINERNLPDTNDATLEALSHLPAVAALRDYRTYSKLLETYGPQWYTPYEIAPSADNGWVNPHTGKIHPTINQLEAETGRTSATKPNSQNLPADARVRACFVTDPPDENTRISVCCDADTILIDQTDDYTVYQCDLCKNFCDTKPEEWVIVGVDMSGAELRIIAEDSGSQQWIDSFNNGWDLHSCGTETLYPEEWPKGTLPSLAKPDGWTLKDSKEELCHTVMDGDKEVKVGPCAYFALREDGSFARQKCKCPVHKELRDGNKATNFLLAYGGGPPALAQAIGKSESEAKELMKKHERANQEVWAYLEASGKEARRTFESRSRCGRRRLFKQPTWDVAKEEAQEKLYERMKKDDLLTRVNPDGTEVELTVADMRPSTNDIRWAQRGLMSSIERRGKNLRIQSLNATIAKLAAGCGFCKEGKPFLWHTLPQYKAKSINFIHDEFLTLCPKRYAKQVLALVKDAIKRAGAEFLSQVTMESEGRIANEWQK